MPAKSEKQRRFMAACSHGANYESCPKHMTKDQMRDFARKPRRKKGRGSRRTSRS